MKKRLLATLCLASVLSLAACSKPAEKAESKGKKVFPQKKRGRKQRKKKRQRKREKPGRKKPIK